MSRKIALILSFLLLQVYSTAQINYQFTCKRDTVLIGDPVELQVTLQITPGFQLKEADLSPLETATLEAPALGVKQAVASSGTDYEMLDYTKWEVRDGVKRVELTAEKQSSKGVYTNTLVATFWQEGIFNLTGPTIILTKNDQIVKATPEHSIRLTVVAPTLDSLAQEELAPIKPIIKEPVKWVDYLPAILFVGGLMLIGLIWSIYNKRKSNEEQKLIIETVEVAVHDIALKKLEALSSRQLLEQREYKLYHDQLTFILREYLEHRFDINALELTTKNILKELRARKVLIPKQQDLKKLLEKADLVKFAESEPPLKFHKQALVLVKEFVLETGDQSVSKTFTRKQFEAFFGNQQ